MVDDTCVGFALKFEVGFEEGQYMFYNFEKQVDDPDSVLEVRVADISLFRLRRSRKLAFTGSHSLNTAS